MYVHVLHVHSLLYSVVETRVGRQAQLHRQEVYESLKEYLKGGLSIYFVIVHGRVYTFMITCKSLSVVQ